jgi:chemotaxis protein MotB
MKFNTNQLVTVISAIAILLISCVPARQFEDAKARQKKCEDEIGVIKAENLTAKGKIADLDEEVAQQRRKLSNLQTDTLVMGKSLRLMTTNYDKLNSTYELLLDKNKELMRSNSEDNKKLVIDLQRSQESLQAEQDALKLLKTELDAKKLMLDKMSEDLEKTNSELKSREQKVSELQNVLSRKDSTVNVLRQKISAALTGYENNGLTIEKKNGKVYVSLEERLLFSTGSINVDARGVDALKSLAKVLEQNPDINVLIEGHTDNVPFSSASGAIKDNWDLSVLRATSIVKILLNNSTIDPKRLTAAGHGEHFPIDPENNAEARRKNRRTEIILTPKLDQLLKILETN